MRSLRPLRASNSEFILTRPTEGLSVCAFAEYLLWASDPAVYAELEQCTSVFAARNDLRPGETETEVRLKAETEVYFGTQTEVHGGTGMEARLSTAMEACIEAETGMQVDGVRTTRQGWRRSQGPGTPEDGGTSRRGRYAPKRMRTRC
ncbi:uncharacterized protein SCHCODRAFT_02316344 [Schizophyllum commune H4-8]|uniref:uncharacterized protein n=1 Tax=Schizophyllum commune (strain H4-8 / FGSC 9210) TaxID=578458 RepID=UPI00215E36F9|nr:uncharacterized protein SCHCODRAFT_02316344 [Schizophyllum commune H4-8]KAI5891326.1 hypothetical protein SCHCODRAFT_02316344 [Schizophyllum commune H4-8]